MDKSIVSPFLTHGIYDTMVIWRALKMRSVPEITNAKNKLNKLWTMSSEFG